MLNRAKNFKPELAFLVCLTPREVVDCNEPEKHIMRILTPAKANYCTTFPKEEIMLGITRLVEGVKPIQPARGFPGNESNR